MELVLSVVPDFDPTCTVPTLRDRSLEAAVLKRVVLDLNCEAFDVGLRRRPLRNGPALEDALHLQAEVEVMPRRPMLMNHELRQAKQQLSVRLMVSA